MAEQASAMTNVGDVLMKALASRQASYAQKDTTPAAIEPAPSPPTEATNEADPVETEQPQAEQNPVQPVEAPREDEFLRDEPTDTADVAALKANLRSGFSKKMTELDKRLKELDEKSAGGLDAQKKAQVLDSLLASPDPAAAIEAARKGLGIATQEEQPQKWFSPRVMKEQAKQVGLHEDVADPIEDFIDAYMEKKVLPGYLPVLAWVQQQVAKGATSEWDGLAAKYGEGATQFQRQAYELAAKAQIPLENALKALLPDDVLQQKAVAKKAARVEEKQSAQLVRTNGVPAANKGASTYEAKRNDFIKALLLADKNGSKQFTTNRIG